MVQGHPFPPPFLLGVGLDFNLTDSRSYQGAADVDRRHGQCVKVFGLDLKYKRSSAMLVVKSDQIQHTHSSPIIENYFLVEVREVFVDMDQDNSKVVDKGSQDGLRVG